MAFLEDYTYLEQLGQGGYATVYKVRHNKFRYIRALRVLNATIAQGENDPIYQKFLEECALLLRLGNGCHPHIVHIYQPLLKAQKAIVEMDYVDGQDLYHYLSEQKGFIPVDDVICLVTQIGSALAYCHHDIYEFCMDREEDNLQDDPNDGSKVLMDNATQQRLIDKYRIIHNDIHSGNIIRRRNGSFVLLDFGLAIEGNNVVRSSRRRNGAPEFKAPEKWDNEGLLAPQTDIYSFGIVLFEYLTGRVPFPFDKSLPNSSEAEYLLSKAHKEQTPPAIYKLRKAAFEAANPGEEYKKDYPDWLETLIMKCLEKEPSNRFANAKELYEFANSHQSKPVAFPVPIVDPIVDPPPGVESVDSNKEPSVESGPLEGAPDADPSQFEPIPAPTNTKKTSNKWILGFILLAIIAIGGYFLFPSLREVHNRYWGHHEVEDTLQLQQQEVVPVINDTLPGEHQPTEDSIDIGNEVEVPPVVDPTPSDTVLAKEPPLVVPTPPKKKPIDKIKLIGYVNLGLPSGTLWRDTNEGGDYDRYTYDEAVETFGNNLPTKVQFEELISECTWEWEGSGYKVIGPNGNSIYLPAFGYRDCGNGVYGGSSIGYYCSATSIMGTDDMYSLLFNHGDPQLKNGKQCFGQSVRLVKKLK